MFKNKKFLTGLAIFGGLIIGLSIIARITGAIAFFKTPTGSNIPAIQVGEQFICSNLVSPQRFDFITFYHTDSMQGRHTRVYRLCGMPGDKIEIKAGNFYVNGNLVDDSLNLNLYYQIPESSLATVIERFELKDDEARPQENGKALVLLTTQQAKELKTMQLPVERYLLSKDYPSTSEIEAVFHHPWTVDDFGPVQVPENHYFVLGDNRYMAEDSRFIGFIKKSDLFGVALGVK